LGVACVFFLNHFRDYDRVVIDPIDDPPGRVLVHDS